LIYVEFDIASKVIQNKVNTTFVQKSNQTTP